MNPMAAGMIPMGPGHINGPMGVMQPTMSGMGFLAQEKHAEKDHFCSAKGETPDEAVFSVVFDCWDLFSWLFFMDSILWEITIFHHQLENILELVPTTLSKTKTKEMGIS